MCTNSIVYLQLFSWTDGCIVMCFILFNTNYYYYVFLEELEELVSYNNVLVYTIRSSCHFCAIIIRTLVVLFI